MTAGYNEEKGAFVGRVFTRPSVGRRAAFEALSLVGYEMPRVTSENKCKRNRLVKVKKDRKGTKDPVVGKDRTNKKGKWSVPFEDPEGKFYAFAPKKVIKTKTTKTICRADKSKTFKP